MPHRWAALKGVEIFRREPFLAEFWAAVAALGWAVIATQGHGDVTDRPAYAFLGQMVTDARLWEWSGIVLGTVQIGSLLLNDRPTRRFACFMLAWWWLLLAVAIFQSDPDTPGWWLFAVNSMANLFSLFRLAPRYV